MKKSQMSLYILLSALLLVLVAPLAIQAQILPPPMSVPQNVDNLTQIFANADGSYSLYLEMNTNSGVYDDRGYHVNEENKSGLMHIVLSQYVELLDYAILSPQSSEIAQVSQQPFMLGTTETVKLSWTTDLSKAPEKFMTISTPFGDLLAPYFALNTLRVDFRVKAGVAGDVPVFFGEDGVSAPVHHHQQLGSSGGEGVGYEFWLNGVRLPVQPGISLEHGFFLDEGLTTPVSALNSLNQQVWLGTTAKNSGATSLSSVQYRQDFRELNQLTALTGDATLINRPLLAPSELLPLGSLAASQSVVFRAKLPALTAADFPQELGGGVKRMTLQADLGASCSELLFLDEENLCGAPAYVVLKNRGDMGNEEILPAYVYGDPNYGWRPDSPGPFKTSFYYAGTANQTQQNPSAQGAVSLDLLPSLPPPTEPIAPTEPSATSGALVIADRPYTSGSSPHYLPAIPQSQPAAGAEVAAATIPMGRTLPATGERTIHPWLVFTLALSVSLLLLAARRQRS